MAKHLQNIVVVSVSTLGSRVLGLANVALASAIFGIGEIISAFNWAFTLPNLFRRLMGEGALTSAFVPVLAEAQSSEGRAGAFLFLNQVLSRLTVGLVVLMALLAAGLGVGELVPNLKPQVYLGFHFGFILVPYLLLVCLAATLGAALNVLGRFGVAALSQVWLNLAMITALLGGELWSGDPLTIIYLQCASVLLGGVIQVAMPVKLLWHEGWRPQWDWTESPRITEMMKLFLPAVLGASIVQINVVVSRSVALGLNESATTVLNLSSRLMELPLGLFTIAVATVLFPNIALLAAKGDVEGLKRTYAQGLRLIFAITVPAAAGLVMLREPVVRVLFQYGMFSATDVTEVAPVVALGALGIPFFSLATLATRGFHSLKDTRTPVRVAKWTFVVNLALTLILMFPLGTPGLALANLSSSVFQSFALQWLLTKGRTPFAAPKIRHALGAIGMAVLGMIVVTELGRWGLVLWLGSGKLTDVVTVVGLIPVSALVYLGLLRAGKFEEMPMLGEMVAHFFAGRAAEEPKKMR